MSHQYKPDISRAEKTLKEMEVSPDLEKMILSTVTRFDHTLEVLAE